MCQYTEANQHLPTEREKLCKSSCLLISSISLKAHSQPTITSSSSMSVSLFIIVERFGCVLPKSPWTNSFMYLHEVYRLMKSSLKYLGYTLSYDRYPSVFLLHAKSPHLWASWRTRWQGFVKGYVPASVRNWSVKCLSSMYSPNMDKILRRRTANGRLGTQKVIRVLVCIHSEYIFLFTCY